MDYAHGATAYRITLMHRGENVYEAVIGDRTLRFNARRLPDGGWLIDLGGRQQIIYAARDGDRRQVFVDGENYTLTIPRPRTRRRDAAASAGELVAQMPGQVIDVRVEAGQTVHAGDTLLIMEAMKMELRITAPADGTVQHVGVAVGTVVERGQPLVVLHQPWDYAESHA